MNSARLSPASNKNEYKPMPFVVSKASVSFASTTGSPYELHIFAFMYTFRTHSQVRHTEQQKKLEESRIKTGTPQKLKDLVQQDGVRYICANLVKSESSHILRNAHQKIHVTKKKKIIKKSRVRIHLCYMQHLC